LGKNYAGIANKLACTLNINERVAISSLLMIHAGYLGAATSNYGGWGWNRLIVPLGAMLLL